MSTARRINQSEMTTFMRCPRKWDLAYRQGLRPVTESTKLSLGTLVHAGLKQYYQGLATADEVLQYVADQDPDAENPDPDNDLAYIMLTGYFEWLEETGADVGHEFITVEQEIEVPLRPGLILHGTPDLMMRDDLGALTVVDHKTVAAFGALADRRLQLNFQGLTYAWMWWKLTGERPTGLTLNMLRKVKRTASAKPPFYSRETVFFNQAQLEAHERHMVAVAYNILDTDETYPVPDGDCTWKCEFLTPCTMLDEHPAGAREMLNELYVKKETR